MFKGLGNLASMMKQAQQMQGKMTEIQERLAGLTVEGDAGGRMVIAQCNGQQKLLSVKIDPVMLTEPDAEMLEDLVVAAVNQAMDKAKEAAAAEMSQLAGGMNIPGLGDALENLGMGPGGETS